MLDIDISKLSLRWEEINEQYENFIEYKRRNLEKPLVFFGAGAGGSIFFYDMKSKGIDVTCFCDNNDEKTKTKFCGLMVYSYDDLKKYFNEYDIVLSDGYMVEKLEQLKRSREKNNIFYIEKTISYNCGLTPNYFMENINGFNKTCKLLSDEKSVKDMKDFLLFSMTGDVNHFHSTDRIYTYFDKSVFALGDEEVFIDIGSYRGETIMAFLNNCKNMYNNIIGIEADHSNFSYLKSFVKDNNIPKIELYNYAAWDHKCILRFDSWESAISKIIDDNSTTIHNHINVSTVNVNAIHLDSIIYDKEPTYIKMDIEGAEMKALMGCANSIKNYMPKLAVSVYHKKEDLLQIPTFLKKLVPEYKFYLRNYGKLGGDTVLYASV